MKSLSPLEPLKQQVTVFKGLWNPTTVEGEGGHYPKMNMLSGLKVKKTTTDVEVGTTMDQLVAAQTGKFTPVSSVVLGTERPSYSTDSGFTSIYSAYISWSTPTTPSPKEIYPQQAFDQLFDDGSKRKRDRSILDLVLDDAKTLAHAAQPARLAEARRISHLRARDRTAHRAGREVQQGRDQRRRLAAFRHQGRPCRARPPAFPPCAEEHLRLMFDIMLLAFQMDRTRVATFMMNNDLSNMRFREPRWRQRRASTNSRITPDDEHRLEMYQKVNEYQVKLWAERSPKCRPPNEGRAHPAGEQHDRPDQQPLRRQCARLHASFPWSSPAAAAAPSRAESLPRFARTRTASSAASTSL